MEQLLEELEARGRILASGKGKGDQWLQCSQKHPSDG